MPEIDNCAKSIKARNVMLAIRKDKAPRKDTKELYACIGKLNPKKFGVILHDKEQDENGNIEPPGYHAMITFDNACSVNNLAKQLGIPPQNIEVWDKGINNGFSYMLHRTAKARAEGKHQYDPSEVIANFDFEALMETIPFEIGQAKIARDANPKTLLDAVYAGVMTKEEAEKRLTGSQYAYYGKKLVDVWNKRQQRLADEWRQQMTADEKQAQTIWIYGPTGTGKTDLAREIAGKRGKYYKSGSSRDMFQGYNVEAHTIILDELREDSIRYDDLLKILDPFAVYSGGTMAPSRYQDKALAADFFLITSPYSPERFYKYAIRDKETREIDKFDQLLRRLTLIIQMTDIHICPVEYKKPKAPLKIDPPQPIPGLQRPNPYSQKQRPASRPNPKDVFDSLFNQDEDTDTTGDKDNEKS